MKTVGLTEPLSSWYRVHHSVCGVFLLPHHKSMSGYFHFINDGTKLRKLQPFVQCPGKQGCGLLQTRNRALLVSVSSGTGEPKVKTASQDS